jgi:hypothetical protein
MITALHFLLLVVLWHFDGATREVPWAWRVEGGSAYVSSVVNFKDIVVLNYKEQNPFVTRVCNDIINFRLSNSRPSLSFFSWPNCSYRWRPSVFSAFDFDTVNSVTPIAIRAKDDGISNSITTRARGYGRGEPIILEMITENGGAFLSISGSKVSVGGRLQSAGWVVNLKPAKMGPT